MMNAGSRTDHEPHWQEGRGISRKERKERREKGGHRSATSLPDGTASPHLGIDGTARTVHVYGVQLTKRQQEILTFIEAQEMPPSAREMAEHFGCSVGTIADHIAALRAKGFLAAGEQRARGFKVAGSFRDRRGPLVNIPLYGSIPAGFADERHQEAEGCVTVDAATLRTAATARMFALRVKGDSMIERHIVSGDIAIVEHGREARPGDVVAALIDGESTLKELKVSRGKAFLRAANPKYPDLIPVGELAIQGVLVGLVRALGK